ncbi:hypothetical protein C5F50_03160 [Nitrosopumilus ureiphilus]|uniref:Prenyltransferase n=2 Tax=Nitrosopumilus ureiphilus TaxID=1470067 RepID=A0A7D5M7C0_9ARCH|nr:hypothetical protein C5F50_03160 [Nitrosopumilus ureiphilus]
MIALVSGLIALGMFSNDTNQLNSINAAIIIFGTGACVTMASLATYLYNDLYDIKSDSKNNRNIRLSDVQYQYNVIFGATVLLFVSSGMIAFALNFFSGIACLAFIALSVVYSHPATSLKDKFMVKTIVTAAGASLASMIGIFSYSTSLEAFVVSDVLWTLPLLSFLFYFVLGPLGDISDFKGDKFANKVTIPIKIGVTNTFYLMFGVIFTISLVLIFLYVMYDTHIITPIIGICISLLLASLLQNTKSNPDKQRIKHARKYSRWHLLGMLCSVLVGTLL